MMSLRVNEHCILEDLPLDAIYLASEELEDFRKQFEYGSYIYAEIEKLIDRIEKVASDFTSIRHMLRDEEAKDQVGKEAV